MSNVHLDIAGRRYTIACAAGEEAHIKMLGRSIDAKLAKMPAMTGQSEPRTLLFAALLLADELHEAQAKAAAPANAPDHAASLENLAERLESLATQLERSAGSA
jgi:cell division protein ZapA